MNSNIEAINNYNQQCVNAVILHRIIQNQNRLPSFCLLQSLETLSEISMSHTVIINVYNPNSYHHCHVVLMVTDYGQIEIHCSINGYVGNFLEISVNTILEVFELVQFCQDLLREQPHINNLTYIRIPPNLLDHWCVSPALRDQAINPPGVYIDEYLYS